MRGYFCRRTQIKRNDSEQPNSDYYLAARRSGRSKLFAMRKPCLPRRFYMRTHVFPATGSHRQTDGKADFDVREHDGNTPHSDVVFRAYLP